MDNYLSCILNQSNHWYVWCQNYSSGFMLMLKRSPDCGISGMQICFLPYDFCQWI